MVKQSSVRRKRSSKRKTSVRRKRSSKRKTSRRRRRSSKRKTSKRRRRTSKKKKSARRKQRGGAQQRKPRPALPPPAVWREIEAQAVVTLVTRKDPATNEVQVLTLQRGSTAPWAGGMWSLPGGKIDPGEDTATAAARELLEESGLRVEAAQGTMLGPSHYTPDGEYGMCAIVFHEFKDEDGTMPGVRRPELPRGIVLPFSASLARRYGKPTSENDDACWVGAGGGRVTDAAGHEQAWPGNIVLINMAIEHRNARDTGGIVWE